MPANVTITLPVFEDDTNVRKGQENLEAVPLGAGRLQLVHSPGFVYGLAAGDTIVLDASLQCGFAVVKRGGNVAVWLFLRSNAEATRLRDPLGQRVRDLGGWLDGGMGGMLIFTVPYQGTFDHMERTFGAIVRENEGSAWMFANVYEQGDARRPMNWWREVPA